MAATSHADTPVDLVIEHLEHILKHVGEDGVGFGSDFDGAKIPAGIENAAGLCRTSTNAGASLSPHSRNLTGN
jgi:microsomal dipeptidase-like Zn-dependent dipeptidase